MRYGLAVTKSLRSVVMFCLAIFLILYLSRALLHYLFGHLSGSETWALIALTFTAVAPIASILFITWKGRLRDLNAIWLTVLTTLSTIALFILWGYIVSNLNRPK